MKHVHLLLILAIFATAAFAQQNVGIGTTTPNPNAKLDIVDTTRGILIPRMDSTHRLNMPVVKGMMVYDSSYNYLYFNDGSTWRSFITSGSAPDPANSSSWTLTGNSGINPGINFIGTTNNTPLVFRVNNQKSGIIDPISFNTFLGYNAGPSSTGNANTGLGAQAMYNNSIGQTNVAVGGQALYSNTTGSNNVAIGGRALYTNTGDGNTAVGNVSMYSNVSGSNNTAGGKNSLYTNSSGNNNVALGNQTMFNNTSGSNNTATGNEALKQNSMGGNNTATGYQSLYSNTTAYYNTATGFASLYSDTTGNFNTAAGYSSLYFNSSGFENTAFGNQALFNNTTAAFNVAVGSGALATNTTGAQNIGLGTNALHSNITGSNNIGIGFSGGANLTTGGYNIDIGNSGNGGESNTIRIGSNSQSAAFISGIWGSTSGGGIPVYINSFGQLGTNPSSARFKENIEDIGKISNDLYKLRPVSFRYKAGIPGGDRSLQYGLIAEEVEKVNSNLIAYDTLGNIYTVKYQLLTPLLLNELIKEHQLNLEQQEVLKSHEKKFADQERINKQLQQEIGELKKLIGKQ